MALALTLRSFREGEPWPARRAALVEVLRARFVHIDEDGSAMLYAGDGGSARVQLDAFRDPERFDNATVHVEVLTPGLSSLVHELAAAGGMSITPSSDPPEILLTDGDQLAHLPASLRALVTTTCTDGEDLHWRLTRGTGPSVKGPTSQRGVDRSDFLRGAFKGLRRDR